MAVEAAPALAEHLGARCHLDLGRVDAAASWWGALARAWPSRMSVVSRPEEALPYIELNGSTWEGYLAGRSQGFKPAGSKDARPPEGPRGAGPQAVAGEEVMADMWTLFRLHDARWRGREVASSVADPRARDFHAQFVLEAQRRGWLRLYLLEVDAGRSRVGTGGGWATASPTTRPGSIRPGAVQRRLPAAGRERARGDRRGRVRVRPAARRRGLQGALRDRQRLGRSVLLAPRVSTPRLAASARAWIARARSRGVVSADSGSSRAG